LSLVFHIFTGTTQNVIQNLTEARISTTDPKTAVTIDVSDPDLL